MAYLSHLLLFFSYVFCLKSASPALGFHSNSVFFPVSKDTETLQYVATVSHGTPQQLTNLVVDLGGPFVWMDCDSAHASSSRKLISSCSANCSRAKVQDLGNKAPTVGGCRPTTNCNVFLHNGVTGLARRGDLVEDIVAVASVDRFGEITTVDHFFFSCAPTFLLQGLAGGADGTLGLGKSPISLPFLLSSSIGHSEKFILCLSSSHGVVLTGNGDSLFGTKMARSLSYTPLYTNQHDYSINVRSVKINGKRLAIDNWMLTGTKLSTILGYSAMESSIYAIFSESYVKAAEAMNMTRVASVSPFQLCFSSEGIENSMLGPVVPEIDLILQSEMVKWKIHGRNSMVKVSNEVMCLGVLNGGSKQSPSIIMGGFQLEDNVLEFDIRSSMLGFSSSLLLKGTTCSSFLQLQHSYKLNQFM